MKTYTKKEFCKDVLLEMSPGDSILVICTNYKETDSVKQICYNTVLRDPNPKVSKYKTDKDAKNNMVLITAIGN